MVRGEREVSDYSNNLLDRKNMYLFYIEDLGPKQRLHDDISVSTGACTNRSHLSSLKPTKTQYVQLSNRDKST